MTYQGSMQRWTKLFFLSAGAQVLSVRANSRRERCGMKRERRTSDCAPEDQQPSADAPNEFVPHVVDARSHKKGPRLRPRASDQQGSRLRTHDRTSHRDHVRCAYFRSP